MQQSGGDNLAGRDVNFADVLGSLVDEHGDRAAVEDGDRALTYRQFALEVASRARQIEALGDKQGPIGILLPVNAHYIVSLFAVLVGGRSYVPLDPAFPPAQLQDIIEHAGIAAVIVDQDGARILAETAPDLSRLMVSEQSSHGSPAADLPTGASPDDIAAIYYTSGSTGRPKGVFYDQATLIRETRDLIEELAIVPTDRVAMVYRPAGIAGSRDVFAALLGGACICIVDLKRLGASESRRRLNGYGVTVLHAPPPVFRMLFTDISAMDEALPKARLIWLMGDRIVASDVDLFARLFGGRCRLYAGIATTETLTYAAWWVDPELAVSDGLVSVGYAWRDGTLRLIDGEGVSVDQGQIGEVVATVTSCARGYWRDEDLTRDRFRRNQARPGAIDYHTGDIGRFRDNGLLDILGRKDRQVKVRGNTVQPDAVEAILAAMPGISRVAVIARREEADATIVAYCAVLHGADASAERIKAWARERLAPFMCPTDVVIVESLPTLVNGKTDYKALEALDGERKQARPQGLPVSSNRKPISGIVRAVWEQFLPGTFDLDQGFLECGGHSLMALKFFATLEEQVGQTLPLTILANADTPSDIIVALKAVLAPTTPKVADRPTLFFFSGLYSSGLDLMSSEFARLLSDHFDVRIVDYRPAENELRGEFDAAKLLEITRREMVEAGRRGPLWVIGYSFGARVAAEAILLAARDGVVVEQMINIDGRAFRNVLKGTPPISWREGIQRFGLSRMFARRFSGWCVHRKRFGLLRLYLSFLKITRQTETYDKCHRFVMQSVRQRVFQAPPTERVPAPLLLLRSADERHDLETYPDLGWGGCFEKIELRHFDYSHTELTKMVDVLAAEILALRSA